ncbi:MAG: phosphotransferase [Desulfatiglans sp.]|jgi:hypothetical protein|nr:phosphotransferase [Thermodesulfobacteriota bacterium]MEE4352491.1 phosphotransferase [Desulfatiglans sp.]
MDINSKVEKYLREYFGQDTELTAMERLGQGMHGIAYLIKLRTAFEEKRLIMKTLFPSGFGHDHYSDRAQVLLLANANYNRMEKHIRAIDVVGETPDRFISLKEAREFYIFMSEAKGTSYFKDLTMILKRGRLTEVDRKRAQMLGHFLAQIHAEAYQGENAKSLYRRRIRDLIGHGECIMGLIDTYDPVEFTTDSELVEYAGKCLKWWGRIRDKNERLCRVHGDYHPGNIWFEGDEFTLLDRSRGSWGEAADDVSCLGINYIHYSLKETGTFRGSFADLFREFIKSYMENSKDRGIFRVIQPFFAFRILVIVNPKFYPDDRNETKRKLLDFGHSILETEQFEMERITNYIEGR